MNGHVIQPEVISKLKRLSLQIENLREVKNAFGLKPKQELKLSNKENKLTKLIKNL